MTFAKNPKNNNKKQPFGICDKTKAEGAIQAYAAVMLEVADDISVGHVIGSANGALAEGALNSCVCSSKRYIAEKPSLLHLQQREATAQRQNQLYSEWNYKFSTFYSCKSDRWC